MNSQTGQSTARNVDNGGDQVCLEEGFQNADCYDTPSVRWSFDAHLHICKRFTHSGCSRSNNLFCSEFDCVAKCQRYYNPTLLNTTEFYQKSILKRQIVDRFSLINRLCFKRYQIDPAKECHFNRITAWYYNRLRKECRSYEACAPSHIIYRNQEDCERKCRPLYEDIDPYSRIYHGRSLVTFPQSSSPMRMNQAMNDYGQERDDDPSLDELSDKIENLLEHL
eukprot:TCALIF_04241-PA protein Name:"Protein of unknown function" AED:0.35 eAED:0.35 QI:0/0.5/0.33/0.66/0/0/3/271/222